MAFNSRATLSGDFLHVSKDSHTSNLTVTNEFKYLNDLTVTGKTQLNGNTGPKEGKDFIPVTTGGVAPGTKVCSWIEHNGGVIKTSVFLKLEDLETHATAGNRPISGGAGGISDSEHFLLQYKKTEMGTLFAGRITCLETIGTGGDKKIGLYSSASGTLDIVEDMSGATHTTLATTSTDLAFDAVIPFSAFPADLDFIYLCGETASITGTTYTTGSILLELWGTAK
ncbi:MAG: hypothetical protein CMB64_03960 [Euryarchaeota archaeon]|nr:hypothetical protein [Euryarchaeota archaeon]